MEQLLLELINDASRRRHALYCALAGLEITGEPRLVRAIQQLDDALEKFWVRRRRLMALAYQRRLRSEGWNVSGETDASAPDEPWADRCACLGVGTTIA